MTAFQPHHLFVVPPPPLSLLSRTMEPPNDDPGEQVSGDDPAEQALMQKVQSATSLQDLLRILVANPDTLKFHQPQRQGKNPPKPRLFKDAALLVLDAGPIKKKLKALEKQDQGQMRDQLRQVLAAGSFSKPPRSFSDIFRNERRRTLDSRQKQRKRMQANQPGPSTPGAEATLSNDDDDDHDNDNDNDDDGDDDDDDGRGCGGGYRFASFAETAVPEAESDTEGPATPLGQQRNDSASSVCRTPSSVCRSPSVLPSSMPVQSEFLDDWGHPAATAASTAATAVRNVVPGVGVSPEQLQHEFNCENVSPDLDHGLNIYPMGALLGEGSQGPSQHRDGVATQAGLDMANQAACSTGMDCTADLDTDNFSGNPEGEQQWPCDPEGEQQWPQQQQWPRDPVGEQQWSQQQQWSCDPEGEQQWPRDPEGEQQWPQQQQGGMLSLQDPVVDQLSPQQHWSQVPVQVILSPEEQARDGFFHDAGHDLPPEDPCHLQ